MADKIYCIVSPHPGDYPSGLTDGNGYQHFFIKFGDGLIRDTYDTHNPSFRVEQAGNIAGQGNAVWPGRNDGTRVAKFIEKNLLRYSVATPLGKWNGVGLGLTRVGGREWYKIRAPPGGIGNLRVWLENILDSFPTLSLDGNGEKTSDRVAADWVTARFIEARDARFH